MSPRLKRVLWVLGLIALVVVLLAGGLLAWLLPKQRRLMYFPRAYPAEYRSWLPVGARAIEYTVDDLKQVSFYIPPRRPAPAGQAPPILVLFNGNASLALDWLGTVKANPRDDLAFYLVDFPGYGASEGSPSRASIIAAQQAAWPALAKDLGLSVEQLDRDVSTLGFSMGAAAAMEFAAQRPVKKVVLLAPFTSLHEMAERHAGGFVAMFVLDRFDNVARLDELASRPSPPSVLVLQGSADQVIPVEMGRALGTRHPNVTRFIEFPGVDHGGLPGAAGPAIIAELTGTWPSS